MDVYFGNKRMSKLFSDGKRLKKKYGQEMAEKIMQRLDDMLAADNLAVLMKLPGRHHPLKGDRKGQFACDLVHPHRLIYEPANDPLPVKDDGSLIYEDITEIVIIEIVDYHD